MSARALTAALAVSLLAACGGGPSGPTPPPAPAGVKVASPVPGAARATWDPAPGATSYVAYVRPDGGATAAAVPVSAGTVLFRDGLAPGSRAGVAIASVGPAGEGPRSAEASVDVAPLAVAAVGALAARSVSLHWTAVSAGTYAVYRSTVDPATGTVDPATTTRFDAATAAFDDGTAAPATTYSYAVSGLFEGHESPLGPALEVTTPPGAPATVAAAGGNLSVALTWSTVPGASGYTPLCGTTAGMPDLATAWPETAALAATVGPLAAGTAYSCWIRSESASGHGLLSAEATALTLPAAPADVLAESSLGSVSVTWSQVPSATAYVVTWSIGAASPSTAIVQAADACPALGCAWSQAGLVPGETYHVTVAAQNATGDGPVSAAAVVTVSPAPTPVVGTRTAGSVSLSWAAVPGATGYVVYRATSLPLSAATAARFDAGPLTAYVDGSAAPDTAYHYAVAAVVGIESAPGGTAPATTLPAPPAVAAARGPGEGQVTVSWTDAQNHAVTYDLYWSDSGPATLASTRVAGATSPYALGGLDASRTYHVAVVAIGAGGASALSNDAAAAPYPTTQVAVPVTVRGVTSFGQTVQAAPGDLEVFPGQANDWDLDGDLSIVSGGHFDGPFWGAMWLFAGQLATRPPTYDSLSAETFALDGLPPDQRYAELTFSTPLFGDADGVRTAARSGGATLELPPPSAISGATSGFLNGTSDSRLAQPLDLRGATSATLQWLQRDYVYAPGSGLGQELGPYFQVVLRDPATGGAVATLAPSCGTPDAAGVTACTASLAAGVGAQRVLSFEARSASPGLVELDDVAVALDGAAAALLPGGDFEASGAWTVPSPAESQNVTAGARAVCTRRVSTTCAESLWVTRTFFTAPSSTWARIVDVFENRGTVSVSADVVHLVLLGDATTTVVYAPAGAGGKGLSAFDASLAFPSPTAPLRDFGLAFGDATALYRSASADGTASGGGFVFLVRPITVPAGGRVALASFVVLDGLYSGRGGGASAPAIDAAVTAIATGFRSLEDTSYRDWMTQAQLQAIANW